MDLSYDGRIKFQKKERMRGFYFSWYTRNEKYIKGSAKMVNIGDVSHIPPHVDHGNIISLRMGRMKASTPTITAPRAAQRAFTISAGVKINISK
jgi:hypothetical protein